MLVLLDSGDVCLYRVDSRKNFELTKVLVKGRKNTKLFTKSPTMIIVYHDDYVNFYGGIDHRESVKMLGINDNRMMYTGINYDAVKMLISQPISRIVSISMQLRNGMLVVIPYGYIEFPEDPGARVMDICQEKVSTDVLLENLSVYTITTDDVNRPVATKITQFKPTMYPNDNFKLLSVGAAFAIYNESVIIVYNPDGSQFEYTPPDNLEFKMVEYSDNGSIMMLTVLYNDGSIQTISPGYNDPWNEVITLPNGAKHICAQRNSIEYIFIIDNDDCPCVVFKNGAMNYTSDVAVKAENMV